MPEGIFRKRGPARCQKRIVFSGERKKLRLIFQEVPMRKAVPGWKKGGNNAINAVEVRGGQR